MGKQATLPSAVGQPMAERHNGQADVGQADVA